MYITGYCEKKYLLGSLVTTVRLVKVVSSLMVIKLL